MKELSMEQLENINGRNFLGWAGATVTELGLGAAAGAIGAAGIAIYEAFN